MEIVKKIPYSLPFHTQRVTEETYVDQGYSTLEEGLSWTARSCGIASLRMVLDGVLASRGLPPCPSQGELLRLGLERQAYKPGVGWIHRGLVDLARDFNLPGEALRSKTTEDLLAHLTAGRPCIASVTPRFAGGQPGEDGAPLPPGGHLVPVYGFAEEAGRLTALLAHHPSCFADFNWPEKRVEPAAFSASFSGNFMVFYP